jgi:hypothetical protein
MGLRPTQGNEKRLGPATTLYETVTLSFVIPSEVEGSAVPRTFRGNAEFCPQTNLSSRLPRRAVGPERIQISYHAELASSTFAPFRRERRMRMANANKFDRKSGGA